jgi:hypothetical protein
MIKQTYMFVLHHHHWHWIASCDWLARQTDTERVVTGQQLHQCQKRQAGERVVWWGNVQMNTQEHAKRRQNPIESLTFFILQAKCSHTTELQGQKKRRLENRTSPKD